MRGLGHQAIDERSLVKKQAVFTSPPSAPATAAGAAATGVPGDGASHEKESVRSPGCLSRIYHRVLLCSLQVLQLLKIISVKKKIVF